MSTLKQLLDNNKRWSAKAKEQDPQFFEKLEAIQRPEYLWIGCSDSRVPANQIVDLAPGELFVHRNIANQVVHTDFNCLAVVQYAIEVLRVKHIIVCGHYGCGGVAASLGHDEYGVVDNWLRHIKDISFANQLELNGLCEQDKINRLCELNVIAQVQNLTRTKAAQYAWDRAQTLSIHGWVYSLHDGVINDLQVTASSREAVDDIYQLHQTQRGKRPNANF
jgi:carbonic anhydrase|tara:strand:+ start:134 stop:796 length:663 start_codon:yes stop_codon:yes gene_type:complete